MTARYALVGDPIALSPSPAMHNAAFAHLGLDAHYELRPTPTHALTGLLDELRAVAWEGLNVTTPLKTLVAPHVELDPVAARARAVNTLYRREGAWRGALTDVEGVRAPLEALGVQGGTGLILGAGGATRAAVLALEALGCRVVVAARRIGEAIPLLEDLAPKHGYQALDLNDSAALTALWPILGVVVQATPVGKAGDRLALPWSHSAPELVAFEMLYRPLWTPFLLDAREHGARLVHGWQMLLHQGVPAFELWTGQPAPIAEMQRALTAHVGA